MDDKDLAKYCEAHGIDVRHNGVLSYADMRYSASVMDGKIGSYGPTPYEAVKALRDNMALIRFLELPELEIWNDD
jgi:hypothetical protein